MLASVLFVLWGWGRWKVHVLVSRHSSSVRLLIAGMLDFHFCGVGVGTSVVFRLCAGVNTAPTFVLSQVNLHIVGPGAGFTCLAFGLQVCSAWTTRAPKCWPVNLECEWQTKFMHRKCSSGKGGMLQEVAQCEGAMRDACRARTTLGECGAKQRVTSALNS